MFDHNHGKKGRLLSIMDNKENTLLHFLAINCQFFCQKEKTIAIKCEYITSLRAIVEANITYPRCQDTAATAVYETSNIWQDISKQNYTPCTENKVSQ